jgi:uncharacterized protein YybS (DUF2232 family)
VVATDLKNQTENNIFMNQWRNIVKTTFIGILTAVMSTIPFLFSAPLVRANILGSKRSTFWFSQVVISVILWFIGLEPLAISFLSVVILIGLFTEVQNQFKNVFVSGLVSIMASFGAIVYATQQWLSHQGLSLADRIREQVQVVVAQATAMNSLVKLDVDILVLQTPSALVSLMIIAIALSLILEDSFIRLFKIKNLPVKTINLMEFKLPDFFIWIAMSTFLFSFLDLNNKVITAVAMNILNTLVVLYFFQGLAVVESFFTALRVGIFIRLLTYVVLLIQLFFLVSAIGVIDFWL